MLGDESSRSVVVDQISWVARAVDTDAKIFANFKMEVGDIHAVVGADGADLLPAQNVLALADNDFIEVRIHRVDRLRLSVFEEDVTDENNISPAHVGIAGIDDIAVADGVNRVSKIGVSATETVPVLAGVVGEESAARVISLGIRLADGLVEGVGDQCADLIVCRFRNQDGPENEKPDPEVPASHGI